jgi:hypothetical protein
MSDKPQVVRPDGFDDAGLPKGTFSHSQHSLYKKCGQAYFYKYIDGIPYSGNSRMAKGKTIHRMVEAALRGKMAGKIPGLAEVREMADLLVSQETADVLWEEGESEDELKQQAVAAYTEFHVKALSKITPVAVEAPFAVKVGDVPMIGYIDLIDSVPAVSTAGLSAADVAAAPRQNVVVDLKTSEKSWTQDQVDRSPQLTLYAHVIGTTAVRIDNLVQLKAGVSYKPVSGTRTRADVDNYVEDLNETVRLIKSGVFPKASLDSWACTNRCEYWGICRGRAR